MFLQFIGFLVLLYVFWQILSFTWFMIRCYILPSFGFAVDLTKYGKWAVVTGSTDGIGKAYAEELARRGINIVLVSRNIDKLRNVSKHIVETYGVETKIHVFDFASDLDYTSLKCVLKDLDIGILVNNVGMSGEYGEFFERIDIKNVCDVAYTNLFGELNLTHIVLPGMVERKRGVVVHISSGFGFFPFPLSNIYPPTKAFVVSFTKGLQAECEVIKDLHHQLITPLFVSTNMVRVPVKPGSIPSSQTFAKYAVNTIGLTDHAFGYWGHEFLGLLLIPKCLANLVGRMFFPGLTRIRLFKRFTPRKQN